MRGRLVDEQGRIRRSSLTRTDVFGVLLAGDFDPALRSAFPGAVRSALAGDAASMLRLRRRAFRVDGEAPAAAPAERGAVRGDHVRGDHVAMARRTSPPDPELRLRQAAAVVGALPASAFYPFDRGTVLRTDLLALCAGWLAARAGARAGTGAAAERAGAAARGGGRPAHTRSRVPGGWRRSSPRRGS